MITLRVVALLAALAAVASCPLLRRSTPTIMSPRLSAVSAAHAFQQGIEAAQLGLPIDACPFAGDDAVRAWRAGWKWFHGSH